MFKNLGEVDAIRFLSQISYEKRDYLKIQDELFEGMTVEEIFRKAKQLMVSNLHTPQSPLFRGENRSPL